MKKKRLQMMLVAAAALPLAMYATTPLTGNLKKAGTGFFPRCETPALSAGTAQEAAVPENGSGSLPGQQYVEGIMATKGLVPGNPPIYQASEEEQEHPLSFIGMLQYSSVDGRIMLPYGLYKFSTDNGLVREKYVDVDYCVNRNGFYSDNTLYGFSSISLTGNAGDWFHICSWDTDLWEPADSYHGQRVNREDVFLSLINSAMDPDSKTIYSFSRSSQFGIWDPVGLSFTPIAEMDAAADVRMFAIGKGGKGYTVNSDRCVYQVELTTGKMTEVGRLDFEPVFAFESMTYDERGDKFYMCVSEEKGEEMLGRLCELNVEDATTRLIGYLPQNEEYTCLKVLYTPENDCPAKITDLRGVFHGTSNEGTLSFTIPGVDVGGNALSGTISYDVYVDNNLLCGESGAPGERIEKTFFVGSEGRHKAVVVLRNDAGEGVRNAIGLYSGVDTPMAHDVSLTIGEDGMAELVWDATVGEHGGYVDVDALRFDVVRYPGAEKVAEGISAGEFSESLAGYEYSGFYYDVTAMSGETVGKTSRSNTVRCGNSKNVPYFEDFSVKDDFEGFTVIDANNDGTTWKTWDLQMSVTDYNTMLNYTYSVENDADDWVLTPPLKLKGGMAYNFKFKACAVSDMYTEILEVGFGRGENPEEYEEVLPPTNIKNPIRDFETWSNDVIVAEDGDYRFGFHVMSQKLSNSLFIDDIELNEICMADAPGRVGYMQVLPGEEGELTATIEFDAPVATFSGDNLDMIDKIEVWRGGTELVCILTDIKPGEHCSAVDADAVNGMTEYSVVAYNKAGKGVAVSASAYIGYDSPYSPRYPAISDNLDGSLSFTWDAPVDFGTNGGYVEASELLYNVYMLTYDDDVLLGSDIEGESYNIQDVSGYDSDSQSMTYFGVEAYNELGTSDMAQTSFVVGRPYAFPFDENFIPGRMALWYVTGTEYNNGFSVYSGFSADGDNTTAGYMAEEPGNESTLHSGKISIKGAVAPKLVFAHYQIPGADNTLSVYVRRNGAAERNLVFHADYSSLSGNEPGWVYEKIDLGGYSGCEYVMFDFEGVINDSENPVVLFDDVNVRDVRSDDLEAAVVVRRHVTKGDKVKGTARIRNVGDNTAEGAKVNVRINGENVAGMDCPSLTSFGRGEVEFEYQTSLDDPDEAVFSVEIDYPSDKDMSNNISAGETVTFADPLLPKVNGLSGTAEGNKVSLKWNGVEENNTVTDSFEGYDTFLKDGFGGWKTVDGDGVNTPIISELRYEDMGTPLAFMTFDFGMAGIDLEANPQFKGQSGTQVLMSIRSQWEQNDDWLISPSLSGDAQTVSLYAASRGAYINDTFEVRYSTTGDAVEDFTELVSSETLDNESPFTRYEYELPAGAQYFAVHNNSNYGGMLLIDDISYEGAPLTLVGYNVYRDGELAGTVDAGVTEFAETLADGSSEHTYFVTAVFREGESSASERVAVSMSGIGEITVGDSEAEYYDLLGRRMRKEHKGVVIMKDARGGHRILTK